MLLASQLAVGAIPPKGPRMRNCESHLRGGNLGRPWRIQRAGEQQGCMQRGSRWLALGGGGRNGADSTAAPRQGPWVAALCQTGLGPKTAGWRPGSRRQDPGLQRGWSGPPDKRASDVDGPGRVSLTLYTGGKIGRGGENRIAAGPGDSLCARVMWFVVVIMEWKKSARLYEQATTCV